jgi:purine catabolism regulator
MSAVSSATDLRTVLRLALPLGSRLVSGYPATPVSGVSHLRAQPSHLGEIRHSELLLVSTETLANTPNALPLEALIERLTATEASALAVQGTLSPRTYQVARQHNFPLVALPERAVLNQVERSVRRLLNDRAAQVWQRVTELERTLQRHAAGYRGLTTMLNALARILDRPVVIHDRQGSLICRGLPASQGHDWDAHLAMLGGAEFIRRFDLDDRAYFEDDWQVIESPAGLTVPLISEGRVLGYLSALTAGSAPDDFDLLALEHSAPILSKELTRRQALDVGLQPARHTRDWIAEWLSSPPSEDMLLAMRAGQENFQPAMWYAVAVFHWVPGEERVNGAFSPERMVKLLRAELSQRRVQAPVGLYADRAIVLFPLDEPHQTQRLKQVVRLLYQALAQSAPDGDLAAGVGRPAMGLTALRESFREAERALALPRQLWEDAQIAFFGDVSLYELLLGVRDPNLLTGFCNHWLSALTDYDAQHHTDLVPTLYAYFENNGNMARTAHVLNIHRNTLVYRLGRITDILQLDMDDSNVRLNLHLALKVHKMLTGG